ncbi:MAG: CRISPR-associated helicase Cas3' [Eubacteriales bacterium]
MTEELMQNSIAKSFPRETITEHTGKLITALNCLSSLYGNYFSEKEFTLILIACENHDKGKVIAQFQQNIGNHNVLSSLNKDIRSSILALYKQLPAIIPHGYISPVFMNLTELKKTLNPDEIYNVVNAVYYHHTRDIDFNKEEIDKIAEGDLKLRFPDILFRTGYKNYVYRKNSLQRDKWLSLVPVLGMLNRLDYHASANLNIPFEIESVKNGKNIAQIVHEALIKKHGSLRPVQTYMMNNSDKNLVVTASTGIGKTEAALLWSGGCKTFYTLPVKVSINAIYKRICDDDGGYGYGVDHTTLLHSDAAEFMTMHDGEGDEANEMKYSATRLFSFPMTVCTVDQLFTFVYMYHGSEKLLATLKYSKVIIDEIQSYSPPIAAKILFGLKLISDIGGKFAVITATLPPILEYFMKKLEIPYDKPSVAFLSDKQRHLISYRKNDFDYKFIKESAHGKKVLIICNTVKKAQAVYNKLRDDTEVQLLHSRYLQRDRKLLEEEIMRFAGDKNAHGIWISTQIVEASLDIDFDVLFTEMCSADNLLQRLGRCYRQRQYNGSVPNVYIYDSGNGYGNIYIKDIYDRSVLYLQKYNNKTFIESEKTDYINSVYNTEELLKEEDNGNMKGGYIQKLKEEIDSCNARIAWHFNRDEVIKKFRDIISVTVIPDSIYDENSELIVRSLNVIFDKKKFYKKKEKISAEDCIRSLTISLPGGEEQYVRQISKYKNSLLSDMKIFTITRKYDFDNIELCGVGLCDD